MFSLILNGWTPLKERIFSLSASEKSPSGPIIMQTGLFVNFDLSSLSKDELEDYGRTIGIELDRRHSKSKLVKELEDHIDYLKTV